VICLLFISGCGKTSGTTAHSQTSGSTITARPSVTTASSSSPAASSDVASIINKAKQAVSALKTYFVDSNISSAKSAKTDKSDQVIANVIGKMVLDLSSRSMQMNNKTYVKTGSGQIAGPLIVNSVYIQNNTLFVQGLFPDSPTNWSRTALTDEIWQAQNQVGQLIGLLQPSYITLLNPEMVHSGDLDVACDVLQVTPDLKALWAVLIGLPSIQLPSEAPKGITYDQIIKSFEMKLWTAQSTGLPVKTLISVNIQVDPSQVPSLSGTVTQDINLGMQFYDYNKPAVINVPSEALATDVPDIKDFQPGTGS
jgi:hypothetical protein